MRMRILLVCCAAVAFSVGVTTATAGNGKGGGSDASKTCQGRWKTLAGAFSEAFKTQGDCVTFVTQGGTPTTKGQTQLHCESFGGKYSTNPASSPSIGVPPANVLWTCNNASQNLQTAGGGVLVTDCLFNTAGALSGFFSNEAPWNMTCSSFDLS